MLLYVALLKLTTTLLILPLQKIMILFQIIQNFNFISTTIDHISETNKFMMFYQQPNLFLGHKSALVL